MTLPCAQAHSCCWDLAGGMGIEMMWVSNTILVPVGDAYGRYTPGISKPYLDKNQESNRHFLF